MHKFYNSLYNNVSRFIKYYEDLIGIKELRFAQMNVIKTEQDFLKSQIVRRQLQTEINEILTKRNEINSELENTPRGQKKFLQLVTEEHEIINQENELRIKLENAENHERETFSNLSSKLRESHEKEREQSEKTKYWSVGGSLIGVTLGILGATLNNYLRNKEIRRVLTRMEQISNKESTADVNISSEKQDQILTILNKVRENFDKVLQEHQEPSEMFETKLANLSLSLEKIEKSQLESSSPDKSQRYFIDISDDDKLRKIVIGSTSLVCFSLAFMILYETFSTATDALI